MLLLAATERVLHQAGGGAEPEEHHCHCCRSAQPEEHHCHYSHSCNCNGAAQEYWIHRKLRSNIASKVLRPLLYFKRPFVKRAKISCDIKTCVHLISRMRSVDNVDVDISCYYSHGSISNMYNGYFIIL